MVEHLVDGLADDLEFRQPALVEDRDRRLVLDGLLDGVGVDVGAEGAERAAVLLVDRGAGESEETGVRQRLPHVGGEALVLGPVGFVHHHEDVGGLGEGRVDGPVARGGWRLVISWNFWIVVITVLPVGCSRIRRRSRTLSARSGFGKPQAVKTPVIWPSSLVRSVTMTMVGLLLGGVAAEFEREPEHGQALAGALGVPDDAATFAWLSCGADPLHRLVHGDELAVAGQLADGSAALDFEDDEVPDDVEEVLSLEESVEEGVLGFRAFSKFVFQLVGVSG